MSSPSVLDGGRGDVALPFPGVGEAFGLAGGVMGSVGVACTVMVTPFPFCWTGVVGDGLGLGEAFGVLCFGGFFGVPPFVVVFGAGPLCCSPKERRILSIWLQNEKKNCNKRRRRRKKKERKEGEKERRVRGLEREEVSNSSFAETLVCVFLRQGHQGIARQRQRVQCPIHSGTKEKKEEKRRKERICRHRESMRRIVRGMKERDRPARGDVLREMA